MAAASSSANGGLKFSYRSALDKLHAYERAVCRIVQKGDDGRVKLCGTGFLIGPTLVMTCNHVVPDLETAKKCQAQFFKDPSHFPRPTGGERSSHTYDYVKFDTSDPEKLLFSPPNRDARGNLREAKEGQLDFTILFLQRDPALSGRQFFQLFQSTTPKEGHLTYLYQHPEKDSIDVSTGITFRGDFAMGAGSIVKVGKHEVHYVAPAAEGSSGSPVVDASGNLIALHYQGKIADYEGHEPHYSAHKCTRPAGHTFCNAGVRMDRIVESLDETAKAQIKAWIEEGETFYESLAASLKTLAGKIFELPDPPSDFTGREKELEMLEELCEATKGRVVISGLGGVGKTATVLQYAQEHQKKYSFIHFIGCIPGPAQEEPSGAAGSSSSAAASSEEEASFTASITEGLLALASDLKLPGRDSKEQLRALKRHLGEMEEGFLLIFDGVDDPRAFEEIKSYLPSRENGKCIVVTSRLASPIEGFASLDLQPFSPEDAVAYLLKTVSDPDAQQAALLAKELGYLPLALKHAAAYIENAVTISTFKEYLELHKGEGIKLQGPKHMRLTAKEKTVLTTWNISLNAIAEKCSSSITLAGFLASLAPAPIPTIAIKQWFKTHIDPSTSEFERALGYLRTYSFVDASPDLCHIHTLVQQVIRLNFPEEQYKGCLKEALRVFASLVSALDPKIPEDRKALTLFIPHFEGICSPLEKESFPSDQGLAVRLLLNRLYCFHQYGGKYKEALRFAKREKQVTERQYGREAAEVAKSLDNMGVVLEAMGRDEEALQHLQEGLELRRKFFGPKHPHVALSLNNVGSCIGNLGRYEKALQHKQEALELLRELLGPKHPDLALSLNNVGLTLIDLGRYEEALQHLQKALELSREFLGSKHPHLTLSIIHNVGCALGQLGKHEEALQHLQEALELSREFLGSKHPLTLTIISNVGCTLEELGRHKEALQHKQEALELRRKVLGPKHPGVAFSLNNMGFTLGKLGRHDEALQQRQKALELLRELLGPKHPFVVASLNNIGCALGQLGKHEEALEYLQEAVKLGEEVLGPLHPNTSIFQQSLERCSRALELKAMLEGTDSERAASSSSAAAPGTSTTYDDKGKGKHPDQTTPLSDESGSESE